MVLMEKKDIRVAVAGVHLSAETAARFAGQINIFPGRPELAAALGLNR